MKVALLVYSLLVWFAQDSQGLDCYTCASRGLREQWQITSLPNVPQDYLFDDRCNAALQLKNWFDSIPPPRGLKSSCSSACITMMIQDATAQDTASDILYVRGCYDFLVGHSDTPLANKCVKGPIQRIDIDGKVVPTEAKLKYCTDVGTEPCNNEGDFDTTSTCQQSNTPTVTCYLCNSASEECGDMSKTCAGQYCTKAGGHVQGQVFVSKGCSPFNLYSTNQQSVCRSVESEVYIPSMVQNKLGRVKRGLVFDYSAQHCFCNTDRCNFASILSSSMTIISFTILTTLFL